jgi:hypothetical protein
MGRILFCDVMPCSLEYSYKRFGGTRYLHLHCSTFKTEVADFSEKKHQTTDKSMLT